MQLNGKQDTFAQRLAADTGLDPSVVRAWVASEEPASAAGAPNGANNWLNIGAFDSGRWAAGGASVWADPTTAADATAAFILGQPVNGVSAPVTAGAHIHAIADAAGQSVAAQVHAIQASGWASSGYPNLGALVGAATGGGPTPAPAAPSGSSGLLSGLTGAFSTVPALGGIAVVAGGLVLLFMALWASGVTV